ncbi:MAG: molybdopterin molybdotransferase MoeA [Candidatus Lokiarchaeota archaeon]|nr:molybdopterin molybdotransferase MoeA [Candidatus Lokiarchaeota archaeon]
MDITRLKRTGFPSLVPMAEARDGFLARVQPTTRVEQLPIEESLGRVLARDAVARWPVPSFDKAAMDGYALQASDSFGASVPNPRELLLAGSVAMGEEPAVVVAAGNVVKVSTGSMMPPGADAVIKIEDTELGPDGVIVRLYRQIAPGTNVIQSGEDYANGQVVLDAGRRLRPQDIGALSTLGHPRALLHARPAVAVFATGNELVELDGLQRDADGLVDPRHAGPGKIVDSNRYAIAAFVGIAGGIVVRSALLPDDEGKISVAITDALASCDMVVTTGGTSVGERDFVPAIMGKEYEILCHGIAIKPGSATLLGNARGRPFLGLSGFPVAAEIGMLYFGMPALRKLAGEGVLDPRPRVNARIAEAVAVKGFGITRLLRVALDYDGVTGNSLPNAIPVKLSGAGMQRSMVESDGFVEIPPDIEGYEAGEGVVVTLHPR